MGYEKDLIKSFTLKQVKAIFDNLEGTGIGGVVNV